MTTIWRMTAWEKLNPSVHQKRIGGRIANEILMHIRSRRKYSREVSLYEPIGMDKEGNEINLLDIIEAPLIDVVEDYSVRQEIKKLRSLLKELPARELQVLTMRYGLCGHEEMTQREIAHKLGISRSYVSRIEKSALQKLGTLFLKASHR